MDQVPKFNELMQLHWFVGFTSLGFISLFCWVVYLRWKGYQKLRGLPTVAWRPRFFRYHEDHLRASNVTGILPRMQLLGGPYGMYGTVYGLSTPVVHVAHPVPARAILMGGGKVTESASSTSEVATKTSSKRARRRRRSSLLADSCGAVKQPAYNHFKNFSGNGVFTADGPEWKAKRASVLHCLLKGVTTEGSAAAARLDREALQASKQIVDDFASADAESAQNVVPILQRATIGLIYRFLTHDSEGWKSLYPEGDDTDAARPTPLSPSSSSSSLSSLQTSSQEPEGDTNGTGASLSRMLLESYLSAITKIRMIILAQSRSIWFLLPRWMYRSFSDMYQEEEETMMPIRVFAQQAISRAAIGSPLSQLAKKSSHATKRDMLDEAITLLFAGQDTSAATLSWTLHLLSLHPLIQEKVAREARSVLDGSCTDITRSDISNLPYLDAVIKEAMRLYPVAPFVVRRIPYDMVVSDSSADDTVDKRSKIVRLREGVLACVWIYGLHRNPKLWDRPDNFLPERWIEDGSAPANTKPSRPSCFASSSYMPFCAGPRNCVGQPLAQVVLRLILANLVKNYRFEDERQQQVKDSADLTRREMQAGFTILPEGGVMLRAYPR